MFNKNQKIVDSQLLKFGILAGAVQALYCLLAAAIIFTLEKVLPTPPQPIIGFLLFLLFFVFSVAVSAIVVFGYPVYLAFQQKFTEALMTVVLTLSTLAIICLGVFILISIIF